MTDKWSLLPGDDDPGYKWWPKNSNWQRGVAYTSMSYCKYFRGVIDVGAAYGAVSRIYAKNFAQVISVEMNQKLIPHLLANTSEFDNILYYNMAMSDFIGSANFSYYNKWSGLSTLKQTNPLATEPPSKIKTQVRKLDSFITTDSLCDIYDSSNKISYIDLIKIDTEGSELEVLKGGSKLITEHKPAIVVETTKETKEPVTNFLQNLGYVLKSTNHHDLFFRHGAKNYFSATNKRFLKTI